MSKWIEHTALKRNTNVQKMYKNIQYLYTTGKEKLNHFKMPSHPRMDVTRKKKMTTTLTSMWGREKKVLHIVNGNVNLKIQYGNKNTEVPQKKLKLELSFNPAVPSLNIYPKESK